MSAPPDPLSALLRPVARLLNRNISESTPAREACARLEGRQIAVRVRDTGLAARFVVRDGQVTLQPDSDEDPDVVITGSLLTLATMRGEDSIRDGELDLMGDAATAQAFQRMLGHAKPDVEEELSRLVGDTAAHELGEFARAIGRWARESTEILRENIREYLQEESREVPSRYEVDRFAREVGTLCDDVDRLAARIDRLGDRGGR